MIADLKFIQILITCISLALCSGCATYELWNSSKVANLKDKVEAETKQIYITYDKDFGNNGSARYFPKYWVKYKITDVNSNTSTSIIDKHEGYLVFSNSETYITDPLALEKNLDSITTSSNTINKICAVKSGDNWDLSMLITSQNMSQDSQIKLGLNTVFEIPPDMNSKHLSKDHKWLSPITNSYYYMLVHGNKSKAVYYSNIDITDLKPILPDQVSIPITFYPKNERVYWNSLTKRIFSTPLTVIEDIIKSPYYLLIFIVIITGNAPA